MYTRSLSAELIYSLSPNRNITDSLNTFGISDDSRNLIAAVFDDEKGSKMVKLAKQIDGTPTPLDSLHEIVDIAAIKKVQSLSSKQHKAVSFRCTTCRILH